jgi:hypothetical protein
VSLAAALANQGATSPPPAPNTEAPTARLGDRVEDVYFPNWGGVFHAVATGQRVDKINGRRAVTVFYDLNGKRVAYTIVAEPALAEPNADVTRVNGIELRTLKINGRTVVTWRRDDHTCVLSGPGVSPHQLQRLAGWSKVDE